MKYKALLLGFLLLLPVGLLAALPVNAHNGPIIPTVGVTPPDQKIYGPCTNSTSFSINVVLWNDKSWTGQDVYAFDFVIDWSSFGSYNGVQAVTLTGVTVNNPFSAANSVILYNETWPHGTPISTATQWHLAITATGQNGLNTVNATILTLTFHINVDVCWPDQIPGVFTFVYTAMSGDGLVPVPIGAEWDGGTVEIISVQPNVELSTTDPAYNATTNTITEKCVSKTFDIEVDFTNVTEMYSFVVYVYYDPFHLETDQQMITFKSAFPPPYEDLEVVVHPDLGYVYIALQRPSEKPPVCGAVVPAVDIVFHTIDQVLSLPNTLPASAPSTIYIGYAQIDTKCPGNTIYTPGPVGSTSSASLIIGPAINYLFKPSKYDLTEDCVVDTADLLTVVKYMYTETAAGGIGDLYIESVPPAPSASWVDIFDVVAVAKNFGPVDP